MKKSNTLLPLIALLMSASFAQAEDIKLEDNSSILGKWKLYAEAPALHKEKKEVNISWDFKKNGTLFMAATDARSRTGKTSIKVKYSIEDGKIKKQAQPGREKYESCRVIKQENKEMVLKCKYLFFFLKR